MSFCHLLSCHKQAINGVLQNLSGGLYTVGAVEAVKGSVIAELHHTVGDRGDNHVYVKGVVNNKLVGAEGYGVVVHIAAGLGVFSENRSVLIAADNSRIHGVGYINKGFVSVMSYKYPSRGIQGCLLDFAFAFGKLAAVLEGIQYLGIAELSVFNICYNYAVIVGVCDIQLAVRFVNKQIVGSFEAAYA